jgi:hypothetical protein
MKLLIVIGLLVIFGILYFFLQQKDNSITDSISTTAQEPIMEPENNEPPVTTPETESIMERKEDLDDTEGFTGSASASASASAPAPVSVGASASELGPYNSVADRPATLKELEDSLPLIAGELTNLQSTGALDETTQRRISNLQNIQARINDIIKQVKDKQIGESAISIKESEIKALLTALNKDTPLPDIMAGGQLNSYLGNILPSNLNNDPEVTKTIEDYIKSMTTNLSWYFGFKYTSDAEKKAAEGYNRRAGQAPEGESEFFADNFNKASTGYDHQPDYHLDKRQTTDEFANMPHEACRGPAHFDWKRRSTEICRAIKGRGLDPEDYGCMPEKTEVGSDFSYRGYANMICTRVTTNYDTGLGSLVGCPPLDWPGWRLP